MLSRRYVNLLAHALIGFTLLCSEALAVAEQDATDLKFREFFKLPVGARELEPTEKLMSLAGKRVRMVGYMVRQEVPSKEYFMLSPLPVSLGDEDDSLADDLPASVVFVHFDRADDKGATHVPGLLRITGILSLGAHEEADGHVSTVRLQLDPGSSLPFAATHALNQELFRWHSYATLLGLPGVSP